MDQGAPPEALSRASRASAAANGLAEQVTAVAMARARLGTDLDRFQTEVQAQMGQTAEKTAWKVAATVVAIVAGIAARKALVAGYVKARNGNPPTNPAARDTEWREALAWTVATSIGVGIARLIAQRGAAAGWEKLTGELPPGLREVSP